MSKRNFVFALVLAALLTASCLFAAGIAAQRRLNSSSTKAAQLSLTNTTMAATTAPVPGTPLRGVDVKLGSNPGGNGNKRTSGPDGKLSLSDLAPGSYWMEIVPMTAAQKAANDDGSTYDYVAVTISGNTLVGKTITRSANIKNWKFVEPPLATARTAGAPVETYANRIEFEIGRPTGGLPPSTNSTIIKSKSNICNN